MYLCKTGKIEEKYKFYWQKECISNWIRTAHMKLGPQVVAITMVNYGSTLKWYTRYVTKIYFTINSNFGSSINWLNFIIINFYYVTKNVSLPLNKIRCFFLI